MTEARDELHRLVDDLPEDQVADLLADARRRVGTQATGGDAVASALEVLRRLAAERAELPLEAVTANSNPLDELHLSSITVGQIVNQAFRELGLTAPVATSSYATSTLAQLAQMLEQLGGLQAPPAGGTWPPAFFGSIKSASNGRTDNARRVDELLAEGFGRSRS